MAFSDGLVSLYMRLDIVNDLVINMHVQHTGEGKHLISKLGPKWASRLSSNRAIGVEVIASRAGGEEQLQMYRLLQENVWAMIQEGFSGKVVEVGKTTAEDLVWWFRDNMRWRVSRSTGGDWARGAEGIAAEY